MIEDTINFPFKWRYKRRNNFISSERTNIPQTRHSVCDGTIKCHNYVQKLKFGCRPWDMHELYWKQNVGHFPQYLRFSAIFMCDKTT